LYGFALDLQSLSDFLRHVPPRLSSRLEILEAQALELPPEERVKLADRLIASVFQDNDIEEAWASEVERRIAEIEAGRAQLVPAADAIARARAAIK